jgi:muramoyltetrapeptide carboxypeptidase LdcA involved in peptidoglycan recycling
MANGKARARGFASEYLVFRVTFAAPGCRRSELRKLASSATYPETLLCLPAGVADHDVGRVLRSDTMLAKPPRLRAGDTVAAISLSSGLPALVPHRYAAGKRQIETTFGVRMIDAPNALRDPDWRNPQARAEDLHWALEHREVRAIFSTVGGDESVRILPFVNTGLIRKHPKILIGFSDITVALAAFLRAGVVAFYGPAVLCDLAENCGIRPFVAKAVQNALFEARPFPLEAAESWSEQLLDWRDPGNQERQREFTRSEGWVWLQGDSPVEGRLVGGCIDVLEFLKGTEWWISEKLWDGAIFFAETSEEAPPPRLVGRWLRNYGSQGILQRLSGMLVARPMNYTSDMVNKLYAEIRRVLREFGREDLPVVANMDFGHTSPQMVVPMGARALIDPGTRRVAVLEAPVT